MLKKSLSIILIFLFIVTITGCESTRRISFIKKHPDLAEQTKKDIKEGTIKEGMSLEEVEASWGKPNHVYSKGGYEVWTYDFSERIDSVYIYGVGYTPSYYKGDYRYLTFENDKLKSISQSKDNVPHVGKFIPTSQ